MKIILLSLILLASSVSQANRLVEIEDYYNTKISDFLKTRYPNSAFSILIDLDTGRQGNNNQTSNGQALPYLDESNAETNFWDRKDLSIGTMISYLNSVQIKINIDGNFSDQDLSELKLQLFDKLKLSNISDQITVTKKLWSSKEKTNERNMLFIYTGIGLAIAFVLLFFLAKLTIRSLVKGLSEPISEIGKSTQNFADQALNLAATQSVPSSSADTDEPSFDPASNSSSNSGASLATGATYDERRLVKELLRSNKDLFKKINVQLINLMEVEGKKDPLAMGSILLELDKETLTSLFKYGYGNWWYSALAQPGDLNSKSLDILKAISSLKIRNEFSAIVNIVDAELADLALLINRISTKEFASLIEDTKFKDVNSILNLLPKERAMIIAKDLFPGEWGQILDESLKSAKFNTKLAKEIKDKILKAHPLRQMATMGQFFTQMDFVNYLNLSSTKDEREFYRSLPSTSSIKKERTPFYEFFDQSDDTIKKLTLETSVKNWAVLLKTCERDESNKVFAHFTDKQKFLLRQALSKTILSDLDDKYIRSVKANFLTKFNKELIHQEWKIKNQDQKVA